jgi:hypothetical protein
LERELLVLGRTKGGRRERREGGRGEAKEPRYKGKRDPLWREKRGRPADSDWLGLLCRRRRRRLLILRGMPLVVSIEFMDRQNINLSVWTGRILTSRMQEQKVVILNLQTKKPGGRHLAHAGGISRHI